MKDKCCFLCNVARNVFGTAKYTTSCVGAGQLSILSRGGSMRTEFWEEGSSLCIPVQTQKKQDVTTLKKVLSHMANTDKNNGLI